MAFPPLSMSHAQISPSCSPGTPGFHPVVIVGAEPRREAQGSAAGTKVLVVPITAHGSSGDHAAFLVVLTKHFIAVSILPGIRAERFRPRVGVPFALCADQDRR